MTGDLDVNRTGYFPNTSLDNRRSASGFFRRYVKLVEDRNCQVKK
jgi:hypothetical protein